MATKIKLPTWKESYAREQNGGASALEKFISAWEPAGESTEAAFRAMLERTLNDTTDELRAENGRLRAELDEARLNYQFLTRSISTVNSRYNAAYAALGTVREMTDMGVIKATVDQALQEMARAT